MKTGRYLSIATCSFKQIQPLAFRPFPPPQNSTTHRPHPSQNDHHRPHPGKEALRYRVKDVRLFLQRAGITP
jgi:hypothetical protein